MTTALQQFLASIDTQPTIEKIYTQSKREKLALKYINECIYEDETCLQTMQMLSVYLVQQWARMERRKLKLDSDSLISIINESGEYFGIHDHDLFSCQQKILNATDQILMWLKNCIEMNSLNLSDMELFTIQALYGINENEVSNFIFNKYFKIAILKINTALNSEMKRNLKLIDEIYEKIEDEIKIVYHNADLLVELNSVLSRNSRMRSSTIDYSVVYETLERCIASLSTYPIDGESIHDIVSLYFQGNTEVKIADDIGKSRTFIRSRYKEGTDALSMLIWGYATPEILSK